MADLKPTSQRPSAEEVKQEILKALGALDLSTLTNLKGKRVDDSGAEAAAADWTLTFWTVWRR